MRSWLVFMVMAGLSASALAGVLPGGINGSVEIKYEDDRLDADQSLAKTKLTLKKDVELAGTKVTPYVYFEDESYEGILSAANRKETESALGLDVLAYQNDQVKLTLGLIYEYENNAGSDDDALLIYKVKADF